MSQSRELKTRTIRSSSDRLPSERALLDDLLGWLCRRRWSRLDTLEYRLVRGRELIQRLQDSFRHFVGGLFADSKHGGVFVHLAGQPVGIDRERDRYRRHRAGELA